MAWWDTVLDIFGDLVADDDQKDIYDLIGTLISGYGAYDAAKNNLSLNEQKDLWRYQQVGVETPYYSSNLVTNPDGSLSRRQEISPALQQLLDTAIGSFGQQYTGIAGLTGPGSLAESATNYQRSRYGLGPVEQPEQYNPWGQNSFTGGGGGVDDEPPYTPPVDPPPTGNPTAPPNPPPRPGLPPGSTDDPYYGNPNQRPGAGINMPPSLGSNNAGRPVPGAGSIGGGMYHPNFPGGTSPGTPNYPNRPGSPGWNGSWNSPLEDASGWLQDNEGLWRLIAAGASAGGLPGLGLLDDLGRLIYPDQRGNFVGPPGYLGDHRGPLTIQPPIGPEMPGGEAGQKWLEGILGEQGTLETGFGNGLPGGGWTPRGDLGGWSSGQRPGSRPGLGGGGAGRGKGSGWEVIWGIDEDEDAPPSNPTYRGR